MAGAKHKRLFFALWPEERTRAELAALQACLPGQRGRWVHRQDLHLTLRFLGQVPAARLGCIEAAAEAVRAEPVKVRLDHFDYWDRPRILCLAATEVPVALEALVTALEENLQSGGFEPERRPYRPHVTLLRKALPMAKRRLEAPITWHADHFVLVESRPGGEPPHYRPLQGWPLEQG